MATSTHTIQTLIELTGYLHVLTSHLLRAQGCDRALTVDALAILRAHAWPGNVRELRNVLLQAGLRARDREIKSQDIRITPRVAPCSSSPLEESSGAETPDTLVAAERDAILAMLARHSGRIGETAAALGIHRATLYRKLRRHIVPTAAGSAAGS